MSSSGLDVKKSSEDEDEEFTKPTEDTDIILNVKGKKLHAVRLFLKTASPVFKTMLTTSNFKEADAKEIDFPTERFRDMQLLLKYISPDGGELTFDASERLLPLADKYQIEGLKERCINRLCLDLNEHPDARMVPLLSLAEQLGACKLRKTCVKLLKVLPADEIKEGIDNVGPKSTVTWKSIKGILKTYSDKESYIEDIKDEWSQHSCCSYNDCFSDIRGKIDGNEKCLINFANDVRRCLRLRKH